MVITISVVGTVADIIIIGILSALLKHPIKFLNMVGMMLAIGSIGTMMYAVLTLSALELNSGKSNLDN